MIEGGVTANIQMQQLLPPQLWYIYKMSVIEVSF